MHASFRKLAAIAMILLITTLAQSYALWSDSLKAGVIVKTGSTGSSITSHKALGVPDVSDPLCRLSEGTVSIELDGTRAVVTFENISQGWIAWIGLVISNDGTLPVEILGPNVSLDANFTYQAFLYGSFKSPGTSGVWGSVDPCDMYNNTITYGDPFPSIGASPLVELDPSDKAIVWILVSYTGNKSLDGTTIVIDVVKD